MPGIAAVNVRKVVTPRSRGWARPRARPRLWGDQAGHAQGRWPMTHTALVNDALFWSLAVMTALLVMFLYAVIVAPPQGRVPTEAAVPDPPAPPPGPPARRPQAPAFPAGTGGLATGAGFVATQAAAPPPLPPPPEASGEPPL